ncbi:MAG: bifunctional metallophosphatase/5'-nucleotidase [Acidobacteria bacterium]|nr:bifunctional metallophosphatase/5'-nucleotidase [Acidobacteriota bacterium]
MIALSAKIRQITLAIFFLTTFVVSIQAQAPAKPKQASATTSRVTLLQLNDVYQISPVDKGKNAGLARVATLRKKILAESPNTLFFLAGDTISPSVASTIFKGEQVIATWNAIGLDYASLGNHEFDFGNDILIQRMKESKFVWLGSNVIDRNNNKPFNGMPLYVIRKIGKLKIGILGLLTPDTETSSSPGKNVKFVDPILTAKRLIPKMRAEGATIIIAVTHLTMPTDKELARTGLIDVILGGHEHELLQSQAGRTPIFKWGSDARTLGRIDLNVNATTRRLESMDWAGIPVTDATPDDPDAAAVVSGYEKKLSTELDKPLGSTTEPLDGTNIGVRTRETNLGDLIADAFRDGTKADITILNGGSIRANATFPVGPITKRDVVSMLPFENPIIKIEATGTQIKAALENGVSQVVETNESGRFPQVAGLMFEYDARKPVGSRVQTVTIHGQPLDEKKTYTIASSTFLVDGGDGYAMFKTSKRLIQPESAAIDSAILSSFISTSGTVSPKVEGRIKRLDQP